MHVVTVLSAIFLVSSHIMYKQLCSLQATIIHVRSICMVGRDGLGQRHLTTKIIYSPLRMI